MVDLDLKDFGGRVEGGGELEYSKKKEEKTSLSLEKALNKASEKIKKEKVEEGGRSIGGIPTVLWTGNGSHISTC